MKPTADDTYQRNFSRLIGRAMYDEPKRQHKAKKIVAVISDSAQGRQREFSVLDVGCSTGIVSNGVKMSQRQRFENACKVAAGSKGIFETGGDDAEWNQDSTSPFIR
jgi:hypothetical protein